MKTRALLAAACAVLLMAVALMAYNLPLDSDRLYFDALYADMASGGRWEDWRLPFAPGYFPDQLVYWASYGWLHTPLQRLSFLAMVQALACAGAAFFLVRLVDRRAAALAAPAALIALACAILVSSQTGAWLFINDNNAHVGGVLGALLGSICLVRWLQPQQPAPAWAWLLALLPLGVACSLSTQLYVLTFAAPAILYCLLSWILHPALRARLLAGVGVIVLSLLAAAALKRHVVYHSALTDRIPMSLEAARSSVRMLGRALGDLLQQPPAGLLLSAFLAVAVVAGWVLAWRHLRLLRAQPQGPAARDATGELAVYSSLVGGVTLSGAVLSGGFVDPLCFRYIPFALGLAVLVLALWLARTRAAWLAAACWAMVLVAVAYAFHLYPKPGGWDPEAVAREREDTLFVRRAAQCVSAAGRDLGLHAGVSQYWLARGVQNWAPAHPMFAVTNDMRPFFWMASIGPIRRPEHYRHHYDFMVVQAGGPAREVDQFMFTPQVLRQVAPEPSRVHRCADAKVELWIYDDDRLDALVRDKAGDVLASVQRRRR